MELVRRELGERAEILCDDRNIVRRWPDGLPGARHLEPRRRARRLVGRRRRCAPSSSWSRHERNEIVPLTDRKEIWQRLLATLIRPMVTADWWQKEMDVLEQIVAEVPCYTMRFDKSGAIVPELETGRRAGAVSDYVRRVTRRRSGPSPRASAGSTSS